MFVPELPHFLFSLNSLPLRVGARKAVPHDSQSSVVLGILECSAQTNYFPIFVPAFVYIPSMIEPNFQAVLKEYSHGESNSS